MTQILLYYLSDSPVSETVKFFSLLIRYLICFLYVYIFYVYMNSLLQITSESTMGHTAEQNKY